MIVLTLIDLCFISVWTLVIGKIYFIIYPPRKLIILYGSHQAAALVLNCVSPVLCGSIAAGTIIHEQIQAPRLQTSAGAAGF